MIKIKIFYTGVLVDKLEDSVNKFLEDYHYELVSFQYTEGQYKLPKIIISYKEE
jgi:hypothetical protein